MLRIHRSIYLGNVKQSKAILFIPKCNQKSSKVNIPYNSMAIDTFHPTGLFLYQQKYYSFPNLFGGNRKRPVAWNGLRKILSFDWLHPPLSQDKQWPLKLSTVILDLPTLALKRPQLCNASFNPIIELFSLYFL